MTETVRVLLLAADPASRNLVIQALDASSAWTTVAASPAEARGLLNANRYGLVIVTNLGIPPWLAIDVVPEDHSYEAMFISGHWDDQITLECQRRRLHPVRVPCDFKLLLEQISKMVSKVRQAAVEAAGQRQGVGARARSSASTGQGMSADRDVGLETLDFVNTSMQVDDRWRVQGTRGFTWWGHRLAQRVSAEPVRHSHGFQVARLSAETDLLRNVASTRQTAERIAVLNHHAALSAFIWDPDAGRVRLRCSAGVHAETLGVVKHLFAAAASLQVADAHIKVDGLAKLLGGDPDVSSHPQSGPRPDMDDMLNVIERLYAPEGRKPTPFSPTDFARAAEMKPAPWSKVSSDDAVLNAVLHSERYPSGTGVLFATGTQLHPQLGSGLLLLLSIPTSFDKDVTLALCHELNLAEAHAWEIPYFFGAWCLQRDSHSGLAYVTFFPAAVCRQGLIEAMSVQMAARAMWARQQLEEGLEETRAYATALQGSADYSSAATPVRQALGRTLQWEAQDALERASGETPDRAPSGSQGPSVAPPVGKTTETASQRSAIRAAKLPLDAVVIAGLGAIALLLAVSTQPGTIEIIRAGLLIGISAMLALTNLRTGIIPDRITLPALVIGLLTSPAAQYPGPRSALLGTLVGGGVVLLIILTTRGGIGGGVLKMTAMIGAFLGWPLTILTLGLSFLMSGAMAWVLMRLGRKQPRGSLEFAPYLAISATISLLVGDRIIRWYVR